MNNDDPHHLYNHQADGEADFAPYAKAHFSAHTRTVARALGSSFREALESADALSDLDQLPNHRNTIPNRRADYAALSPADAKALSFTNLITDSTTLQVADIDSITKAIA